VPKRHAMYNGVNCAARLGAAGLGDARTVPPEHCGIEYNGPKAAHRLDPFIVVVAAAARGPL
jgi:hypothetical protein